MKETFYLSDRKQLPELIDMLEMAVLSSEHVIEIKKRVKQRSGQQNRALHLYCPALAELMKEAGITQKKLLSNLGNGVDLEMTGEMIKNIFREMGRARYGKESTADLTPVELSDTYLVVDELLARITGISIPWPSSEPPAYDGEKY